MRLGLLLLLAGCASAPKYDQANPLVKKILSPRKGYKTLTNTSQSRDGVLVVEEFDLNDKEVRKTLKELEFRCLIGGKQYFICENGPGFCRREDDTFTGIWPFRTKHENFAEAIDINLRYQFLLDAKTRCQSKRLDQVGSAIEELRIIGSLTGKPKYLN